MAFAVRREKTLYQQARSAVLNVVALLPKVRNAFVRRANAVNLLANGLRILPGKGSGGACGIESSRHEHRDFPLIARLARPRAGNFGAVDDAALGAGFGPAAALFITCARGQEHR